ncbi:MAG: hypothetical protein ACLQDV_24195 [Candidatus Binataceae bacterium]
MVLPRGGMDGYSSLVRHWLKAIVAGSLLAISMSACWRAAQLPPQVNYTEIEPSGSAAKPPNCDMRVLRHEPLGIYRKVGIIEAEGSVYATEEDVLPVVKRKACESGADAIVILASKSETTESIVGYYIDAVAIVYGKNPNIPSGQHISH